MPISKNIQFVVVALLNVLLAFSCGAAVGAWIAGHTPDLWTVALPACILLVFFALLTALVWTLTCARDFGRGRARCLVARTRLVRAMRASARSWRMISRCGAPFPARADCHHTPKTGNSLTHYFTWAPRGPLIISRGGSPFSGSSLRVVDALHRAERGVHPGRSARRPSIIDLTHKAE
jgi:hypothetical protein